MMAKKQKSLLFTWKNRIKNKRFLTRKKKGGNRMTKVEKICRLIEERYGKKPIVSSFRRTRAGHTQRSLGAFSWTVDVEGTYKIFGSIYPITKLLKTWDIVEMIDDRSSYELLPNPNIKNIDYTKN